MSKQIDSGELIPATLGIGVKSGEPVLIGSGLHGVAEADADAAGRGVLSTEGTYPLSVKGVDSSGASGADANVAIAEGDLLYIDLSKTPKISKRAGGVAFGYARSAVTSGSIATVNVTLKD